MSLFAGRKKTHNLVVVSFGFSTGQVFADQFAKTSNYVWNTPIDSKSVIVFEGGNDINPSLYSEPRGQWTQWPNDRRDKMEQSLFTLGLARGASFIGVCRGAQLLTALSGGKLFQDVTGHQGTHLIKTDTNKSIYATSVHHQMMNPFVLAEDQYQLVAWSDEPRSTEYLDGANNQCPPPEKEPEVVWYPNTRSLCIQGHPEFATVNSPYYHYCKALVNRFILG